jgi:hypothetical protein
MELYITLYTIILPTFQNVYLITFNLITYFVLYLKLHFFLIHDIYKYMCIMYLYIHIYVCIMNLIINVISNIKQNR